MKAKQIEVGRVYVAKVNGVLRQVRVDGIRQNWQGRTVYDVTNLTTKRRTMFRSASKFRYDIIER